MGDCEHNDTKESMATGQAIRTQCSCLQINELFAPPQFTDSSLLTTMTLTLIFITREVNFTSSLTKFK